MTARSPLLLLAPHLTWPARNGADLTHDALAESLSRRVPYVDVVGTTEVVRYAQGEGYLQMTGDRALVLVDELFSVDDLNASDLQERLKRAEDESAGAEDGSEEKRLAERDRRRYEAFLKLTDSA